MNPIDIRPADLATVRRVLREHVHSLEVRVFGSRVTWNARETSDLDLALMTDEPLTVARMADLRAAFTGTELPFRVDIVDWASTPEAFRKVIEAEYVVLDCNGRSSSADWIRLPLADACSAIDYGLTASASNQRCGPKFLRITDIVSEQIDWNAVPYVAAADSTTEKYRLHDGDIVVARTGASTGASAYIKNPPRAVFASYLVRLRAKPDFSARFLAYVLKSEDFWKYIRGVLGDKSAQPNASASTMTAAPIRAPRDKAEQRAIAHILGTLDDKIELNRRMNATLEAMARALFRSWFVYFDPVRAKMEGRDTGLPKEITDLFPDRLVDSELGEIPEGWRIAALGDMLELAYGKALKAEARRHDGRVPVYGSRGQVGWHDRRLVQGPGIVVGRKGNPGVVTWVGVDFFPIDTTFYVEPKNGHGSLYYLFHALQDQDLASVGGDSAVPGLNRHLAYMNRLIAPAEDVVEPFSIYAGRLFARREASNAESRALISLREALLPKLVSGELRVNAREPTCGREGRPASVEVHGS